MAEDRFAKRIKITPEILAKIAKIDEFKGLWQGSLRLSPQVLGRLKRSVIITSTGASTRIEDRKMEYYEALRQTQQHHKTENEDITPWVLYMVDVLLKQTEKARKIMDTENPEKLFSEKQLLVYNLFHENAELSVADIDAKLEQRVPRATLKQALSRLVTLQMVERIGQGRATRYRKI